MSAFPSAAKVACIGECMVELKELPDGSLRRAYGGDTLNTAVYLARLGISVDYLTALGDDPWSDEMIAGWRSEGIGTALVRRLPGRLPGLYVIQTDPAGERRFSHWRDSAPARLLLDHVDAGFLDPFDVLYLSGITLSIFHEEARDTLVRLIRAARSRGASICFDTNFRPGGWPDPDAAQRSYDTVIGLSDLVFASTQDLSMLYGSEGLNRLLALTAGREVVVKHAWPGCRIRHGSVDIEVEAEPVADVLDTTAAGDSFAAAYIAARLTGTAHLGAARAGHALAGIVVGHPGAIVPRSVHMRSVGR